MPFVPDKPATGRFVPDSPKSDIPDSPALFAEGNINKGIASGLGGPVDLAEDVVNLGKAGVGTVAGMAGRPDLMPEISKGSVGGSKWFEDLMRQHGMITDAATPKTPGGEFAAKSLQIGGNLLSGTAEVAAAQKGAGAIRSAIDKPAKTGIIKGEEPTAKTIRESRDAGYKFPPTQVNPSIGNKALEGLAGKAQVRQEASLRNEQVTNDLAKKALGVSQNTPLSQETIDLVKKEAYVPYEKIRALKENFLPTLKYMKDVSALNSEFAELESSFPGLTKAPEIDKLKEILLNDKAMGEGVKPGVALDLTRKLRADATMHFKAANAPGGRPEELALAQAQRQAAEIVEDWMGGQLKRQGSAKLYSDWVDARKQIAIAHDVESALNPATGNVSAQAVAALAKKGRPLSGELETVANFARAFHWAAQAPERVGGVTQSWWDMTLAGIGAGAGNHFGGTAGGFAGGVAGAATRPATRDLLMSDFYQKQFVNPKP